MKTLVLMLITAVASFVIPVQAIINGKLGQALHNPILTATISFVIGTIALVVAMLFWSRELPTIPNLSEIPWYLYTGGLLGAVYVTTILCVAPYLGTANLIAAAIVGQLVMSLVIDQFGLMGVHVSPISTMKVAGALLLIAGTIMIQQG